MAHDQLTALVTRFEGIGRAMRWYVAVAVGTALLDWMTKALAVAYLTGNTKLFGDRFALLLVYNTGGAGGYSWGPHTWIFNVCVTALAIVMISVIVGHLGRIDRRAPWALGLVAGGATGNLVSMVAGADGVADFLAFRFRETAVVANVADFGLWGGAVLLVPVVQTLLRAIQLERRAKADSAAPVPVCSSTRH